MSSILKTPVDKPQTIAERIVFAMDYRGIKQYELAARTGITKGRISQIVHGGTPGAESLFLIADALLFEPRWIAKGEGPMTREETKKAR